MSSLRRIIGVIHRAVMGSESWHAAWEALKAEIKENWPSALPHIGGIALGVFTWLSAALPWAILVALVAFAAIYTIRAQKELRDGRPIGRAVSIGGDSDQAEITQLSALEDMRRAIIVMLDAQMHIILLLRISVMLRESPQLKHSTTDYDEMANYITIASRFVENVEKQLSSTSVGYELHNVLIRARNFGQSEVRSLSHSELPKDISPYDVETFFKERHAFEATIEFLKHHQKETEGELAYHANKLREQLVLFNKHQ